MSQFIGLGNGSDGVITFTGTHAPTDSTCTGSAGSRTLSATNATFGAGQYLLVIQMEGAGAGNWEFVQIESYVAGTVTLVTNLTNAYVTGAQCILVKQYSDLTISGTLTAKLYSGYLGGVIPLMSSGNLTVSNSITGKGKGYDGGSGGTSSGGHVANGGQGGEGFGGRNGTGAGTSSYPGTAGGGCADNGATYWQGGANAQTSGGGGGGTSYASSGGEGSGGGGGGGHAYGGGGGGGGRGTRPGNDGTGGDGGLANASAGGGGGGAGSLNVPGSSVYGGASGANGGDDPADSSGGIAGSSGYSGEGGDATSNGSEGRSGGGGGGGGGANCGSASMTTIFMGGGGGGAGGIDTFTGGNGGNGGGIVMLFANKITVNSTIDVSGDTGTNGATDAGGGGGGAGGSIFLKARTIEYGTNALLSSAGARGTGGVGGDGGQGSIGRIRVEACAISGSSNDPVSSESEGGYSFCSLGSSLL